MKHQYFFSVLALGLLGACSPPPVSNDAAADSGAMEASAPEAGSEAGLPDVVSPDVVVADVLPSDASMAAPISMGATLLGSEETPAVITPARGVGGFTFNAATRMLTFNVRHTVTGATAAHIHRGTRGTNGGVAVAFPSPMSPMTGSVEIPEADVAALMSGGLYVNIHTATNMGGEIRGQILPAQYNVLLLGSEESPAVTTTANGAGLANYNAMTGVLTYAIDHSVVTPTAAHIHIGARGANGGVAVAFTSPMSPMTGMVTIPEANRAALAAGGLYVNIHTVTNMGGEIRGQLEPIR
ncbi:MAG: CHRD domain-containing protein [Deltaproteobacteria bacterium]|nr:CHRD domain-containing protein [Deltaproteobacteria bacterium]